MKIKKNHYKELEVFIKLPQKDSDIFQLSGNAFKLYAFLLSHQNNFIFNKYFIKKITNMDYRSISKNLLILEKLKFIEIIDNDVYLLNKNIIQIIHQQEPIVEDIKEVIPTEPIKEVINEVIIHQQEPIVEDIKEVIPTEPIKEVINEVIIHQQEPIVEDIKEVSLDEVLQPDSTDYEIKLFSDDINKILIKNYNVYIQLEELNKKVKYEVYKEMIGFYLNKNSEDNVYKYMPIGQLEKFITDVDNNNDFDYINSKLNKFISKIINYKSELKNTRNYYQNKFKINNIINQEV